MKTSCTTRSITPSGAKERLGIIILADPTEDASLDVLFEAIIEKIPAPIVELDKPFQMLVTALAWDRYKGKYAIGRIIRGAIKPGDQVIALQKRRYLGKS